jgi:outer membrane lipoprotein carrier protein
MFKQKNYTQQLLKPCLGLVLLAHSCLSIAESDNDILNYFVNNLENFAADFIQLVPEDEFSTTRSEGYFKMKRPGRLVWDYTKGEQQKIVVDGTNIWIFDKDLEQVSVRPVKEIQKDFPLSWLLFSKPIEENYDILFEGGKLGMQWYNLRPKKSTFFESMDISFRNGIMAEIHLYQNHNHVTQVIFKNIEINTPINESIFKPEVPEGLDIIGQSQ